MTYPVNDSRSAGAGLLVTAGDRYLVQQRGPGARSHQGCWEITAGGVLAAGEDPLDGALRKHYAEMGEPPELLVTASVSWLRPPGSPHVSRRYTAFLAVASQEYEPVPPLAAVVSGWAWLTEREIRQLHPVHPCFAVEFAALAKHA